MIKYVPQATSVVLEEIPGKVSLAIDITNCPMRCPGCHSPFLQTDTGEELTTDILDALIADNFGVNCILFFGEGQDDGSLLDLAWHIRDHYPNMEVALYSGRPEVPNTYWRVFHYIKTGPYIEKLGPLNSPSTNQRLYKVEGHRRIDITSQFWKHGIDPIVTGTER